MAALKSRWLRITTIILFAVIAIGAAILSVAAEEKSSQKQLAQIILQIAALFEPLLILWQVMAIRNIPTSPQLSNRQILINTVRKNWIEGVLQDALRDAEFEVAIQSTLEKPAQQPQPSEPPQGVIGFIKTMWRRGDAQPTPIPNTPDSLAQTFKNANHKLLILGAPGGGKTVLMLQLAKRLLDEAEADERKSVPVVFNLSSWGVKGGSIKEWIIAELKRNYGASPQYAKELVNGDSLIYLLDGLDEVAEARRDECVAELNKFITPTRQLVVCSRTVEYQELAEKLSIPEAVEAQSLTETQFEAYLKQYLKSSETVAKIIATLHENDEVWQEANKPLFINILISTYQDGKPFRPEHLQGDAHQKVQKLLIKPYITRQFQNVPNAPFDNDKSYNYLAWIGWWLNHQEQTVFYLEGLQAEGLHRPRLYRLMNALVFGLVFGLVGGLVLGLVGGLVFGLVGGLVFGVRSSINVEQNLIFKFTPETLRNIVVGGLVLGLVGELLVRLVGGLSGGLVIGLAIGLIIGFRRRLFRVLAVGLVIGLFFELVGGLVGGLVFGLIVELSGESTITQRSHSGQGIRDTLVLGLVGGLVMGIIGALVGELGFGLVGGLVFGLFSGLTDVYKHFLLRFFLHQQGALTFRLVPFLNYARERRLLRQVGGGFIFIHRYVLDYFDDEYQARYLKKTAGG